MNFVDKFDGFSPNLDAHAGGRVHVDTISTHAPDGAIIINDAQLLFTGEMHRTGLDLVLTKDDRELVLQNYFKGEKHAALASPDGAHLTSDIVNALTGYTQYAQTGAVEPPKMIGHVTKLTGSATAIRNGVAVVLNQGDNVYKGDVVQAGSDSTLGMTFIDGTVFGLGPNAKMVLNEMAYDPNGSNNTSLMSLVQGTISFVAGATAKHGDMKVDTPVATMGIRGTAVLVEIDFAVPGQGDAPPAKFQVLVEPDGSTGSYILFDKTTLNPIATVDQAGTQTVVNGQGTVSFLSSAQLSTDAQKIISDVFALKFTDNSNTNTKLTTNFTDSGIWITIPIKLASNDIVVANVLVQNTTTAPQGTVTAKGSDHVAGPPSVVAASSAFTEHQGVSGDTTADAVTGLIKWADVNPGDIPSATASFLSFAYTNANKSDVTSTLTAAQLAAIKAVEIPLDITQTPGNSNIGTATWLYSLPDSAFDFLAVGETLTLTYQVRVDNNYSLSDEAGFQNITITITGTNDVPVITSATQFAALTEIPGVRNSIALDTAHGTITFTDPDLTDTHTVTITGVTATGVTSGLSDHAAVLSWLSLKSLTDSTDGVTGSRSWDFAAADKAFDYLAVGETLTLTYVIEVNDGHGGVVDQAVTIVITGTNDTPVITSPTQAAAIAEIAHTTGSTALDQATGTVTFTDVDLSDTHTVSITGVTETGVKGGLPDQATILSWLSLGKLADSTNGKTGSDIWTFSATDKSFDYLAVGETLTLVYTIQVSDGHGGVVTQPVTITITGTNDTPVITSSTQAAAITEIAHTTGSTTPPDTAHGTVTFTDPDLSDTHAVTITGVTETGITTGLPDQATILSWLSLGTLADSTNGKTGSDAWTFSAADKSFDYLGEGQTLTLVYTIQVSDGHGGVVTQPVTITITGTNDTPVITSSTQAAAITEVADTTGSTTPPDTAHGAVTFTDPDLSDTHTVTITGVTETGTTSGLPDNATMLSWLSLGTLSDSTNGKVGSDAWTFSAADKSFDYLADGQTLTLTYTIQVDDGHGGVVTQPVTITITGTNDTPVITSSTQAAAIAEVADTTGSTTPPDAAHGAVTFTDPDLSDTHTVTITGVTETGITSGLPDNDTILSWLSLGTLADSTNGKTGSDAWTFSAEDKNFDYLADGQTLTLTYTIQVDDGHGGVVTQPVTITITGTNDTPVVTSAAQAATITEVADTTGSTTPPDAAHGTIEFTDPDLSDTHQVTISGVTETGTTSGLPDDATMLSWLSLGELTDSTNGKVGSDVWTFSAADKDFDYLADGQSVTLTYTVKIDDHHGGVISEPVTITITGTNDAPVVTSAAQAATIAEAADTTGSTDADSAHNTITFTDPDLSDTHAVTISGVTETGTTSGLPDDATVLSWLSLGELTDSANGKTGSDVWTFSAADQNFDYLAEGQSLTLTYTVKIDDHHGGVVNEPVTITITGSNDAPIVTSDTQAATLPEAPDTTGSTDADSAHNTITFTDPDLSDTHVVSVSSVTETGTTGGLPDDGTVLSWLSLGELTDSTDGKTGSDVWTFSAADKDFDYLADGETLTLTYNVKIDDQHGGIVNEPVTITITGSNDAPVITSDAPSVTIADPATSVAMDTAHDTITFTDPDLSDTHQVSVTGVTETGTADGLPDDTTVLSWLSLSDFSDATNGKTGSDVWTFSAADPNFHYLAEGEQVTLTYTVQVADNHGGTTTEPITITITGSNDAPVVTSQAQAATITEAADTTGSTNADSAHDTITFTDADLSDTHQVAVTGVTEDGTTSGLPDDATVLSWLSLGELTDSTNGKTGSDVWTFSAADQNFDYLAEGQSLTLTYTVQIDDLHGGLVNEPVTITIEGANEAPTLANVDAGPVTGSEPVKGTLQGNDVDNGDTLTYAALNSDGNPVTDGDVNGQYGSLTVNSDGTYTYVPNASAIGALGEGSYQDTFNVEVIDSHGATGTATLTFDVTGTGGEEEGGSTADAAPVIHTRHASLTHNHNGTETISHLWVTDADASSDETFTLTATTTGENGKPVVLDSQEGSLHEIEAALKSGITFDVNHSRAPTETVTVSVADGQGVSDTVNLIFAKPGVSGPVTMTGTTDKDVFFGTGNHDTFVFAADSNHDTINNFNTRQDHIDLSAVVTTSDVNGWISQHVSQSAAHPQDTLITIDSGDTILLHNVNYHSLTAHDFILGHNYA